MTKDFKNPGLISQVAEFIDKKRIEEGISIDTLCQSAHISKRIYIDFKSGLSRHRRSTGSSASQIPSASTLTKKNSRKYGWKSRK